MYLQYIGAVDEGLLAACRAVPARSLPAHAALCICTALVYYVSKN